MAKRRGYKPYERDGIKLGRRTDDRGRTWLADIPATGDRKRQRVKLEAASEEEAKRALDAFVERRNILRRAQQAHTVGQLWEMWLAERAQDRLNNDIYQANWAALGPSFASRSPDLLCAQDFRDYASGRFAMGRSPWTVHTELVRLRACLKWAAENHHIARRPKVWVPAPGKHRERVLTMDEAQRLVEAAAKGDPHVNLFVLVAFGTGARHKAILDLTWERVDWIANTLQFDDEPIRDPMSKSWRKGRATVPMNRAVRAALEAAYDARQSNWVIEHGGRRLKSIREGFANAVKRAGLADVTPHTIRHSVASWLEDRVGDARRAQLLGHGDIATTRKVYTHSGAELLTEAVSYLDFTPLPKIEERRPRHVLND